MCKTKLTSQKRRLYEYCERHKIDPAAYLEDIIREDLDKNEQQELDRLFKDSPGAIRIKI